MPPDNATAPACRVEVSPDRVDAAAKLTLKVTVACPPAGEPPAARVLIEDHDGARVGDIGLGGWRGDADTTRELTVTAPAIPGEYTWRALGLAPAEGGGGGEPPAAAFSFTVKPHSTRVVVWDTPAAVQSGQPFAVKLGVKCSAGCGPEVWRVDVRDQHGNHQGAAAFDGGTWPGTDALYCAEVALTAPQGEGLHSWEATARAAARHVAHLQSHARFGVRVVGAPACVLTVTAVDAVSRAPVSGAKVVLHPYRTQTDARGVAQLRIPRGRYRLFVSGGHYFPFRSDGELQDDTTITAELRVDEALSDADLWS